MALDYEQLRVAAAEKAHGIETEFGRAANQAALNSGTETLKALLLINGGSCVAMLAFIGTLATKDRVPSEMAPPLISFAVGAGLAVFAGAASYFTNLCISGSSTRKQRSYVEPFVRDTSESIRQRGLGEIFRWISVTAAALGILAFAYGVCSAYSGFKQISVRVPSSKLADPSRPN